MTSTPNPGRRNARSRVCSILQRHVVISADVAAIRTHRELPLRPV